MNNPHSYYQAKALLKIENRNKIYKQQFKTLQLWEQLSQQQQLWQLM